jgi:hypothetical protein
MIDPDMYPFFKIMIGKTEKGLYEDQIVLDPDCVMDTKTAVVVFILKANLTLVKTIARLIHEHEHETKYLAFICPRYTVLCSEVLESANVLASLTVHELPYEFIPIEKDVLTLDDNQGFRNLMLGYSLQTLTLVKHSLQRLEALYGKIPLKYAKGQFSCQILTSLMGRDRDAKPDKEDGQYVEIDGLVLMDRSVDFYTPLATQMTYEGVIDEFFGIRCGSIEVDDKVLEPESKGPTTKKTLYLTSQDDLMFAESRDLHFNMMKTHFPRRYQEMKSLLEKKDAARTVAEMAEYMAKLRNLKIPQLQATYELSTFLRG